MKKRDFFLALALSLLAGVALANGITFPQSVISGGGGHGETGIYTLDGAIGQAVTGSDTVGSTTLCSGFPACAQVSLAPSNGNVYLPIIIKNN
jgi:hypothetical protein